MMLEIGRSYRRGTGAIETVAGPTKVTSEWVWTIQGNWYRQCDGRFITCDKILGHVIMPHESVYDLNPAKEVRRDEYP